MGQAKAVTDANFKEEVLESDIPVLVDFWASWCGPCQMMGPIIDKLAEEYEGKVKVVKLNVDENPQTPAKYGIRAIPTLIIFKNGEIMERMVGAQPKTVVEEVIKRVV
ncbi:MAG: thioredoxin [Desulfobacterota bacterium]|nr:thioredoxin [Thermodesulfobacteriota bacterium]MDW8002271.1 thioredoxin [Deltaproteobacteria bacterium]